jgi:low temperature requirement protein LtrA
MRVKSSGLPVSTSHTEAAHVRRRMAARDPHEPHRAATPLELLFDLCFVVAIAQVAARLHHGIAEGHTAHALLGYVMVFFAIWWAWMNFTWFASAYDVDDVPYRLLVFVQMAGVLVLAAGVPSAFEAQDFTVITIGYAIMRVGLLAQWLRAARDHVPLRKTALRYALGILACQLGWFGLLVLPASARVLGFFVMVIAEVLVPLWAERAGATTWHPHHITERYQLLTLIVLGESVLSATLAAQAAIEDEASSGRLFVLCVGSLLVLFSMWWIYFAHSAQGKLVSSRTAFQWGYGHLPLFAATAAVGAGIAVAADHARGHAHISRLAAGAAVAVPVALYLLSVWVCQIRLHARGRGPTVAFLVTTVLVLLAPLLPGALLVIGLLLSALATVVVVEAARHPSPSAH